MNKLNIGIFGASGFIGSNLANYLIENINFKSLSLFTRNPKNETHKNLNFKEIKFDIKEIEKYEKELEKLDVIFYLLSNSIPLSSWNNPASEFYDNVIPFINFMETISKFNIKRIIFTSSAGTIYGSGDELKNEKSLITPHSPYGIGKITIEFLLDFYEKKYNIRYTILRIANIYGPNQDTSKGLGFINKVLENLINNDTTSIYGNTTRNYIYIKDVVKIMCLLIENLEEKSEILNVSSDFNLESLEVINVISKTLKIQPKIELHESRNSDNQKILVDNTKLKERLIKFEFTSFEVGLKETLDFICEKNRNTSF